LDMGTLVRQKTLMKVWECVCMCVCVCLCVYACMCMCVSMSMPICGCMPAVLGKYARVVCHMLFGREVGCNTALSRTFLVIHEVGPASINTGQPDGQRPHWSRLDHCSKEAITVFS